MQSDKVGMHLDLHSWLLLQEKKLCLCQNVICRTPAARSSIPICILSSCSLNWAEGLRGTDSSASHRCSAGYLAKVEYEQVGGLA